MAWVDENTGQDVLVDLNLNRDLIPESYMERYHHEVRLPGLGYLVDMFRPLIRHLTNEKGIQDVKVQKSGKLSNEDGCPSWSVEAMCEICAHRANQTKQIRVRRNSKLVRGSHIVRSVTLLILKRQEAGLSIKIHQIQSHESDGFS